MPELHVFKGEVEWVVAESPEDAVKLAVELWGPEKHGEGYSDPEAWEQLADDYALSILDTEDRNGSKTVKTCAEWARDNGRGFLCSTEW